MIWDKSQVSCLTSGTVHTCVGTVEFADGDWILLTGGTPSARRYLRICLRIGRSPKTSLNNIEPERGED
jgi:hypothetical protein